MDRTILIIEDEQKINDILAFSLGKDGYKTLSAFDGVKGLEMALKENPDLIFLDVMPEWTVLKYVEKFVKNHKFLLLCLLPVKTKLTKF